MSELHRKLHYNSTNVRANSMQAWGIHFLLAAGFRFAPTHTQHFVRNLFFSPAKPALSDSHKKLLGQADAFDVLVHEKRIRCWKWGEGPGILLVHGWNGRGLQLYRFILPLLESGYSVVAFDAPAHGDSEGTTTSYFEFTDAVRAFIKADSEFDINAVIGHSLGAAAAINALSKEKPALNAALIAPALKLKEILYNTFDRYGIPAKLYRNMIASFEKRYGYDLEQDNPIRLLEALNRPVLIVHDRDDQTIPYLDSRKAAEASVNIRLFTTEGLGHKRILNDETVKDAVVQYISGHPSRPVQREPTLRRPLHRMENYPPGRFQ